jgi:hypothetical protein
MESGFGEAPVKTEGAGVAYDQAQEVYTARYTHETIALAFSLTEEAVEDNLYDRLSARYTKALARSMAQTKQIKAAAVSERRFHHLRWWRQRGALCSTYAPHPGQVLTCPTPWQQPLTCPRLPWNKRLIDIQALSLMNVV